MTATLDGVTSKKKDKPEPTAEQKLAEEWIKRLNALDDWYLSVDGKEQGVEQLVNSVPRAGINLGGTQPEVGMNLIMHIADNQEIPVTITEVTDTHVTLDANHPLAGEKLIFDVERVE